MRARDKWQAPKRCAEGKDRVLELLVADIGGTNARFAIAAIGTDDRVELHHREQFRVSDFNNIGDCLHAYAASVPDQIAGKAVFAVAAPAQGPEITFTNSNWRFSANDLRDAFSLAELHCINDFVAVAHCTANAPATQLRSVCGPKPEIRSPGVTTVMGPGTGLGVAYIVTTNDGYRVVETEASHIGFSPSDDFEIALHRRLMDKFGRVSAERICSGPGLGEILTLLAEQNGRNLELQSDAEIWNACLEERDTLSKKTIRQFSQILGAVSGDLILAQGASRLILSGELAGKVLDGGRVEMYYELFLAKGRFRVQMESVPVMLLDNVDAGLMGAAIWYQQEVVRTPV